MAASAFTLKVDQLRRIARVGTPNDNMRSIVSVIDRYGSRFGLDKPHRLAHFIAQAAHETALFHYDREIWGPTPQQKKYDTGALAKKLGNTPEKDGDGKLRSGKGPFQLTGGYNEHQFTGWARANIDAAAPDFYAQPGLINTDPWEGLSAVWFWDTHGLNAYADSNDIEMITRRINGGLNGFADRLALYTRTALVFLHYPTQERQIEDSLRAFQTVAKDNGTYAGTIDGIDGPKTRAALHKALVKLSGLAMRADSPVRSAPVVEDKPVAVAPKEAERPHSDILTMVISGISTALAAFANLDWRVQIFFGAMAVLGIGLMISGRLNLAKSIRETRAALEG